MSQALKWDKLDWDALAKAIKIGKGEPPSKVQGEERIRPYPILPIDDLSIQLASPKQIEQLRSGVRVQGYGTIFVVFRHSNVSLADMCSLPVAHPAAL